MLADFVTIVFLIYAKAEDIVVFLFLFFVCVCVR